MFREGERIVRKENTPSLFFFLSNSHQGGSGADSCASGMCPLCHRAGIKQAGPVSGSGHSPWHQNQDKERKITLRERREADRKKIDVKSWRVREEEENTVRQRCWSREQIV